MKKVLMIILLLSTGFTMYAQEQEFKTGNFTVETVEYGSFLNGEWKMDGPPAEYKSLFKISKNQVTQINADEEWTYYIEKGPEWNGEHGHYVFLIMDNEGEEYIMIVDLNNDNLRFIYKSGDGYMRITRFAFSNSFVKL